MKQSIIVQHGRAFSLEKGDSYWTLYNDKGIKINRSETESGMLKLMQNWSPERTESKAQQGFCTWE